MIIGDRLRALRKEGELSQEDIEKRTGLKRCYISRVEHGHTVPSLETIEKFARAFELPLYRLFYDGERPVGTPNSVKSKRGSETAWGNSGEEARILSQFQRVLACMTASDQRLLLYTAQRMATRGKSKLGDRAAGSAPHNTR